MSDNHFSKKRFFRICSALRESKGKRLHRIKISRRKRFFVCLSHCGEWAKMDLCSTFLKGNGFFPSVHHGTEWEKMGL